MKTTVPIRLKYRCIIAARFAFLFAPIAERIAVTQVPIFCPMMIGNAELNGTAPVIQSACRIPTDADEDWIIAVRIVPARIPATGLENFRSSPVNSGTSARGFTAPLILSIPNISTAKPSMIVPMSFLRELFVKVSKIIPIIARIGEKELGFSRLIKKLLLSIPVRLKIQDVIVVPILAPIMIPTACVSFMIPEFTNPTTITVVAEDD